MVDVKNECLRKWIDEVVALCVPDQVHIVDGRAAHSLLLHLQEDTHIGTTFKK